MKKILKSFLAGALMLIMTFGTLFSELATINSKAMTEMDEKDKLFYGYNVTKGIPLSNPDALQAAHPIIDQNSDYASHINYVPGSTKVNNQAYSTESLREIAKDFSIGFGASSFGSIYMVDVDLENMFDFSRKSDEIYSQQCELYSMYIARHYYVVQGLDVNQIRNYLDDQFKKNLYAVNSVEDAKRLFENYGTHLITGYTFGGRMNISNYRTTSDSTIELNQGISLENKVSMTIRAVAAGTSASIVEEYGSYENDAYSTSTYTFESFGGEAVSSLTLDDLFTYNASLVDGNNAGFMYTRWVNSINEDKDLAIVGIPNDAQCIPLWELVDPATDSGDIRKYLLDAYVDICGDKYDEFLELYPELTRSVYVDRNSDGILPDLLGVYIGTENNMFYYVDYRELEVGGDHHEIHATDTIYLDLNKYADDVKYSFELQNCKGIDEKNGVFKVTGPVGSDVVISIVPEETGDKRELVSIPITQCNFEGGSGTEKYPYIIINKEQFKSINNEDKYWCLYSDIDFGGNEIESLGNFKGVLDGNYCEISNFIIKDGDDFWGLFRTNSGEIKNLAIKNAGSAVASNSSNEIKAITAGVLCSKNIGTIKNCFLSDVFVNCKYDGVGGEDLNISVGGLAGVNAGTITDCMVKNPEIYVYYNGPSKINLDSISVYAGGLVGKITYDEAVINSPKIKSCVVDIGGDNSFVVAKVENERDNSPGKWSTTNVLEAFSAGLVGYCKVDAEITKSYTYVRDGQTEDGHNAVDAEVYYRHFNCKPTHYYALSSALVIVDKELRELTGIKNNYSKSDDLDVTVNVIKPNKNISAPQLDKCERAVEVQNTEYDDLDSTAYIRSSSPSKIDHILSNCDNLQIIEKYHVGDHKTTYLLNDYFVPNGYRFEIEDPYKGSNATKTVKAFYISLYNNGVKMNNWQLDTTGDSSFYAVVSAYFGEEKSVTQQEYLSVGENVMTGILIDMSDESLYTIYYDQIDDYFNNWNLDNVILCAELADGNIEEINDDSEYAEGMNLSINRPNSIERGENYVAVTYQKDKELYTCNYILTVKEREVDSVKIVTLPAKTTYEVGEKVDLSGLELEVSYKEGESYILRDISELKELEIIGNTVAEGENIVTIGYLGYTNNTSFIVTGEANRGFEKSSGKNSIIVIVVVGLIVLALACIVLIRKNTQKNNKTNTETDENSKNA